MKLTNKRNHPQLIVDLMEMHLAMYDSGESDITCTQIINSPKIVELKRRHKHELEVDVDDVMFSYLGSAVHHYNEYLLTGLPQYETEQRYFREYDGWVISGTADVVEPGIMSDYKLTTKGQTRQYKTHLKWEQQLNINRWLHPDKDSIHTIQIPWFARDAYSARGDIRLDTKVLPVWDDEDTEMYLSHRIELHKQARIKLPPCEDKWTQPAQFAVMKPNRKSAVRLLNSYSEAEDYIKLGNIKGAYIKERPEVHNRCNYCEVRRFCDEQ